MGSKERAYILHITLNSLAAQVTDIYGGFFFIAKVQEICSP